MVVAKSVAGVVFVEVEEGVKVDGWVAGFDELKDGEIAGGVFELLGEGRGSDESVGEDEVVGVDAVVEVIESCDVFVKVPKLLEQGLIVWEAGGAAF